MVSLRTQIQGLQEEPPKAKERAANMPTSGQQAQVVTETVGTTRRKATPEPEPEPEPVGDAALKTDTESAQERRAFRKELGTHEALREKERE